jgi:hypothetical protein
MSSEYVRAKDIYFGRFHFGEYLLNHSQLSNDPYTQQGIVESSTWLEQSGLVLLDTHPNLKSILYSGIQIIEALKIVHVTIPVAGFWYELPLLRSFLWDSLNQDPHFSATSIQRAAKPKDNLWQKVGLSKRISPTDAQSVKETYLHETVAHGQTPYYLIGLAPQGSRLDPKYFSVRYGVRALLLSGCPALCSHTQAVNGIMTTFLSPKLLFIQPNTTKNQIIQIVGTTFNELFERSGSSIRIP